MSEQGVASEKVTISGDSDSLENRFELFYFRSSSEEDVESLKKACLELECASEIYMETQHFPHCPSYNRVQVDINARVLDQIAISWIKARKLQGAVGGPVGNELGSPENPWV